LIKSSAAESSSSSIRSPTSKIPADFSSKLWRSWLLRCAPPRQCQHSWMMKPYPSGVVGPVDLSQGRQHRIEVYLVHFANVS